MDPEEAIRDCHLDLAFFKRQYISLWVKADHYRLGLIVSASPSVWY